MKNRVLTILTFITILAIIPITIFAYDGIDTDLSVADPNSTAAKSSVDITERLLGVAQVVGSIVSVVALIIIGIRYMVSSVEQKAQMKGVIGYYIIGCVLVFATSNILGMAYSIIEGVNPNHTWSTQRVEATCETPGSITRTCSKCKKVITEAISPKGHNYGSWTTNVATCTTAGSNQRTCLRCKKTDTETIAALGHSYESWIITAEATCTMDGKKQKTCSTCKNTETETITKLGHSYGGWTTTKAATCTVAGTKKRTCSICQNIDTQTITALGHSYGSWTTTKAATCSATGSKKSTCTRTGCGVSTTQSIATIAHSYGGWSVKSAATCTQAEVQKKSCTMCGRTETKNSGSALGHSWKISVTVGVYTWWKCERCGIESNDWWVVEP